MRFLLADKVFDGEEFLPVNPVLVVNENALLDFAGVNDIDPLKIETLKGVITPGFINAHCHLELSHLKNVIPEKTGLPEFGKQIMSKRDAFKKEEIEAAMREADREMWEKGIVAVGDISNSSVSFARKKESNINYHTFIELLGLQPGRALQAMQHGKGLVEECKQMGLRASLAPHAPYSTSLELIKEIAEQNSVQNLPSAIHNEESEDEMRFFRGKPSGFDELYRYLKIDLTFFKPPMCSSLEYYIQSLASQRTLLVHNTFASKRDITLAKGKNILWCFCPNANIYIEDRLPDYSLFADEEFCLGTDSLASNHQLDVISEANLVLKNSGFGIENVLQSITSVPANFLGFSDLGKLRTGTAPGLNLLAIENNTLIFKRKLL